MAVKADSLLVTVADLNSINYLEEFQNIGIDAENTLVDARGIADRYVNKQATKQKQSLDIMYHWYNTTGGINLQATNLSVSLWTLGGVAYLTRLKSGTLEITNTGPESSGIAEFYEFPQPTTTDITLRSELMTLVGGTAAFMTTIMTSAGSGAGLAVTVAVTFAGEPVTFSGILRSAKQRIVRGELQMQDVVIEAKGGTPTTSGDTTSLLYLALVGAAVTSFDIVTGINEYVNGVGQTAMISRYGLTFRDKELIEQNITLEVQGGMTVV